MEDEPKNRKLDGMSWGKSLISRLLLWLLSPSAKGTIQIMFCVKMEEGHLNCKSDHLEIPSIVWVIISGAALRPCAGPSQIYVFFHEPNQYPRSQSHKRKLFVELVYFDLKKFSLILF
jgi:hypothetical protein